MRSSRVPLACGLAVLLVSGCTGDPDPGEPPPEEEDPSPIPTEYEGEAPPGIEGEVLRYLHGDSADVHEILDDAEEDVRISSVGEAFLVSADVEDRHLLHDAATGETLWEGQARFSGFEVDRQGEPVLVMADEDDAPFVLDSRGEPVWTPEEEGDTYLDGVVVRYPDDWDAEAPEGAFTVLGTDGEELWDYTLEAAADGEDGEDEEDEEEEQDGGAETDGADDLSLGVPITAWDDVVLLGADGPAVHAHSLAPESEGEELWSVTGTDTDLDLAASASAAAPQVIGRYALPQAEDDEDAGDAEDGGADEEDGDGQPEDIVLLRWAQQEAPSTLSAHDAQDGEPLWTLEEPGVNPVVDPFEPAGMTGSLYDGTTGTLLLPQASGEATVTGIDLVEGEVRWELEDDDESVSPALAFDGYVYGDERSSEEGGDAQVVLDAATMDVVEDTLSARVEAVTQSGHAVLVQDRQRFVYGPPPGEEQD